MANFEEKGGKLFIDGYEVIRDWEGFNGWYWFAVEKVDEQIYFGLVQCFEEEWGYFSEAELSGLSPKIWEIRKNDLLYSGRRN